MTAHSPLTLKHRIDVLLLVGLLISFAALTLPRIPLAAFKSDTTLATYVSRSVANGAAPYEEYVIMHPPVAHLVGAAAILIGRGVGIDEVLSIRYLCLFAALVCIGLSYLVGRSFDERIGLLAAGSMACGLVMQMTIYGYQVRMVLLVLLLMLLLALQHRRWRWAGVLLAAATMTWAGGASFILIAAAVLLSDQQREWRAVREVGLGFGLLLGVLVVYLAVSGGLPHFWQQYALTVPEYAVNKLIGQGLRDEPSGVSNLVDRTSRLTIPDVAAGLAAVGGLGLFIARHRLKAFVNPLQSTLLMAVFVGLIVILVDYQSPFDLAPLLPSAVALCGWLVMEGIEAWTRLWKLPHQPLYLTAYIVIVLMTFEYAQVFVMPAPVDHLARQRAAAQALHMHLSAGERIQAVGDLSIMILAEQENPTRVIHLGPKTLLAMENEGYSLADWERDLRADPPLLMLMDVRNMKQEYLSMVIDWITENYLLMGYTEEPTMLVYARRGSTDALIAGGSLLAANQPAGRTP